MTKMIQFETPEEMRKMIALWTRFTVYYSNPSWETNQPKRAMVEERGTVFVFGKGKRRYGRRYSDDEFINTFACVLKSEADEATKWERRVKNVIKKLNASGLWTGLKEKYENLLLLGYEGRDRFKEEFHDVPYDFAYECRRNNDVEKYNKEFESLNGGLLKEFPFVFYKSEEGYIYRDSFYFNEMSDAKTKSMWFGKFWNGTIKENIANALKNKEPYSTHKRANYDVSFDYNPERNTASYAEEYRGCGNGHYYIAIDGNTALFCEDD